MRPKSPIMLYFAAAFLSPLAPGGPTAIGSEPGPGCRRLPAGQIISLLSLPAGNSPEGIALDREGNVFVGNRRPEANGSVSEILRITPDGKAPGRPFVTLDAAVVDPRAQGVLGLAVDARGLIYAALVTFNPATHGVWWVSQDGSVKERLAGSEDMTFPNALIFDARGNLYVTDSATGSVWRFGRDGVTRFWARDPLLAPDPPFPGFPAVGANGVAFAPPDTLYVANTSRALIARIPIARDGTAGPPRVVAQDFNTLLAIDGIALDGHGDIHGAIAGFPALGAGPLVRVDPTTGAVAVTPTESEAFNGPLSLAFGRGRRDRESVFVTNGALFPGGPGPGVIQAGVGRTGSSCRQVGPSDRRR